MIRNGHSDNNHDIAEEVIMSDRDKAVVDAYARVGMSLPTLIRSFPQFSKGDVTEVYEDYLRSIGKIEPQHGISVNCS